MAYITNDGARLIERARTEGKSIFFGSVRMNTVYKSDPTSLVQKTEEWYGENHGHVVGCISHVSVNGFPEICDSKLAVQCNDNNESWKSIGIYAQLDGEEDEVLLACESIENGEYKDVTIVELPVTLDGVVEDFGLSEGGSGGGEGGGGGVPANMMTTDTVQNDLTGTKTWTWVNYYGGGSVDNPQEGDRRVNESICINYTFNNNNTPLVLDSNISQYSSKAGWKEWDPNHLKITTDKVNFNDSVASWRSIINAARFEQGFDHADIRQMGDGSIEIGGVQVAPNSMIKIGAYVILVIDSNGKIASVRANSCVLDISAAVFETNGSVHSVSGIVNGNAGLSFDQPITPAEGQVIYTHWTRHE